PLPAVAAAGEEVEPSRATMLMPLKAYPLAAVDEKIMRLLLLPGEVPRRYQVVLEESTYESVAAVPMKYTVPFASTIAGTPKLNPLGSSQTGRTPLAFAR